MSEWENYIRKELPKELQTKEKIWAFISCSLGYDYMFDDDDMERKAFQENCDNFDEASSEVYCTLISEGEVKETDINYGGLEIAVENWEAKSWEIRQ
jgi:hypothetical protein